MVALQEVVPTHDSPSSRTSNQLNDRALPAPSLEARSAGEEQPIITSVAAEKPSTPVPFRDLATSENWLINSPYEAPEHRLDLKTLETADRIFAEALTLFKNIRPDYATSSYTASFNWDACLAKLRELASRENFHWAEKSFYVVVFRSCLQQNIDKTLLFDLDRHSHREAMESGGLLMYWFGSPNENRRNLATCIWRSEDDAHKGGTGPWHKRARGAARSLYDDITFERKTLTISDDALSFNFEI